MWGILFFSRPTPSHRLSSICLLGLVPRPRGVGCAGARLICGCGRGDGLPACFPTVPLSRSRSFAILERFALRGRVAWLSVPYCHRSSLVSASFDFIKAFQSVRFSIQSSIGCVRRCHAIQSHRVRPLSAYPFRHLPRRPVSRLRTDGAMPGSASRFPCRLAARLRFPFPPFRLSARRAGRGVVCAVSLIKRRGC